MPSGPMRRLTPRSPRSRTISPSTLIVSTRSRSAPQHERLGIGSGRAVVPVWRGTARNGPVLETGAERMNQSREAKNKALVLEAFEILFNKRDYTAAEGDIVIVHGRFSGFGAPVNWIATDILRIDGGVMVEHWDVIQDEASREQSRSGLPMFGDAFPS